MRKEIFGHLKSPGRWGQCLWSKSNRVLRLSFFLHFIFNRSRNPQLNQTPKHVVRTSNKQTNQPINTINSHTHFGWELELWSDPGCNAMIPRLTNSVNTQNLWCAAWRMVWMEVLAVAATAGAAAVVVVLAAARHWSGDDWPGDTPAATWSDRRTGRTRPCIRNDRVCV